jgi:hypothetical protein
VVGRVWNEHQLRTAHVDLGRRLWPDARIARLDAHRALGIDHLSLQVRRVQQRRHHDAGAVLRVAETVSSRGVSTTFWSSRSVGPIRSAHAGFAVFGSGRVAVRSARGLTLAVVRTYERELKIRRVGSGATTLARTWACPVTLTSGGPPPRCSAVITLRVTGTLRLPSAAGGKVRVVVVLSRG